MSDNVKNIKHLLREAKGVSKRIKGEKYDSLRIDCMNRLGIYTSTIDVNEPFRKWVEVRGNYFQKFS